MEKEEGGEGNEKERRNERRKVGGGESVKCERRRSKMGRRGISDA